jgi:polyketide cyclase/dehydrase/lipid transport protein
VRRWTTLATVTAVERPHRFAFRVTAPPVPIASWEFTIEPVAEGCRVVESWFDPRLAPVRLISTVRTGVADRRTFTQRSMEHTLDNLKEAGESAPST